VNLLRGLLLENMGLKLVALLLAFVVYLHVYTERPAVMTVAFPIELTDIGDSLVVVNQTPPAVVAELKGTGKQLIRLRLAEPKLKVSLAGVGAGHFQRSVLVDDLPVVGPVGLTVSRFVGPQMLELDVDRATQRTVPVAANVQGALPDGLHWNGESIVAPTHVVVRGPRAAVLALDSVRLAPVTLAPARDSLRATVGAASLPRGCRMTPPAVAVRLPITHAR
jgi:YbbR domain-containing protein